MTYKPNWKYFEAKMLQEMTDTLKEEFAKCNHLYRFEAWAQIYYDRFHRLCPGKSDVLRDSSDDENRLMMETWHKSGLAKHDAIMEVVKLNETIKNLKYALLECSEELATVWRNIGQTNPNSHAEKAEHLADSIAHL